VLGKAPQPQVSLDEGLGKLDQSIQAIDEKLAQCEQDLQKLKQEMAKGGSAKTSATQKAMLVLKRKKMLEQQRANLGGTQFNLEQVQFTQQSMQTTALTVQALETAVTVQKQQMAEIDIDKVADLQDEMADLMLDANEINDMMSRNYNIGNGLDDADLDAELQQLQDEVALDQLSGVGPSYLPTAVPGAAPGEVAAETDPSAPAYLVS